MYSHVNMYTSIVVYLQILGLVLETPPTFYLFTSAMEILVQQRFVSRGPEYLQVGYHP